MESAIAKREGKLADRYKNMAKRIDPLTRKEMLTDKDMENAAYGENIHWLRNFFAGGSGTSHPVALSSVGGPGEFKNDINGLIHTVNAISEVIGNDHAHKTTQIQNLIEKMDSLNARNEAFLEQLGRQSDNLTLIAATLDDWMNMPRDIKEHAVSIHPAQRRAHFNQIITSTKNPEGSPDFDFASGGPSDDPFYPGGGAGAVMQTQGRSRNWLLNPRSGLVAVMAAFYRSKQAIFGEGDAAHR